MNCSASVASLQHLDLCASPSQTDIAGAVLLSLQGRSILYFAVCTETLTKRFLRATVTPA